MALRAADTILGCFTIRKNDLIAGHYQVDGVEGYVAFLSTHTLCARTLAFSSIAPCTALYCTVLQVMDFLGSAAFSQAVQALDVATGALVCLKIIKNNKVGLLLVGLLNCAGRAIKCCCAMVCVWCGVVWCLWQLPQAELSNQS